ncbi:hypothetical protein [Labrys wisconsinensis]|uniref:Vacuolar-type H+-ATPase subunit I/STV1 n=1 Tax=Labrys wisconsinensis TaxID=425677 RepID=A0ABU0JDM9_9HYPH|nr:hypothetical protein [Labrys wisconsinensis]MDQ0472389.1 vacuolar-type H+-ATPase subunit I/STV1 [Labrys wisconsinensis]
MTRISDYFLRIAVLAGLLGMGMGMMMGMRQDFSLAPAHAHLNLLGWVSMAIYALFYRAVPIAADGLMPRLHFFTAVVALAVMIPGIALINLGYDIGELLAAVGGAAMLVGFALFGVIVLKATAPGRA